MISAKVVADSMSPHGKRLTTLQLEYPRFIHAEVMTHRVFSRNAASSRAIPVKRMLDRIRNDPAMPIYWGKNQPGMQAKEELSADDIAQCQKIILDMRDYVVKGVEKLNELGLHKQTANRYTEPWMWMGMVVSATEWGNFFNLRDEEDAQPEFQRLAGAEMLRVLNESEPRQLALAEWHHPYVSDEEWDEYGKDNALKCCVARCARVSYYNHDGKKPTLAEDLELYERLLRPNKPPHASPFEHAAMVAPSAEVRSGNFTGWIQYRKLVPGENQPFYSKLIDKFRGGR